MIGSVEIVAAIVAAVQAVKILAPKVNGAITILVAAVLGALAGYQHLAGLDVVSGVVLGLSAVGVHTVATVVGGSQTPAA